MKTVILNKSPAKVAKNGKEYIITATPGEYEVGADVAVLSSAADTTNMGRREAVRAEIEAIRAGNATQKIVGKVEGLGAVYRDDKTNEVFQHVYFVRLGISG